MAKVLHAAERAYRHGHHVNVYRARAFGLVETGMAESQDGK